jgi:hypothetical protein
MADTDMKTSPEEEMVEHVESSRCAKPFHLHSLGHVRLRHEHTNEIILIPAPSLDPNDPLRW